MTKSVLFVVLGFLPAAFGSDQWPQFRGPDGLGTSDALGLPLTWSETNHVKWKRPIHGRGWSSPVIWENQIWLTTATEDGGELFALCVDRNRGKIIYDLKIFDVANPQFCHKFNSYASPTPVIEPGRVYLTFGSPGTACLDTRTGQILWERRDFVCNHFRGAGSSPILAGQLLIMNFDGSDYQYVVALDKRTGKTIWKADRSIDFKDLGPDGKPQAEGDFRKAFSTPHALFFGATPTVVSVGAKAAYAYELASGKELWRVEERTSHSASTRPVIGQGMVFFPTGFSKGQLLAVRPPPDRPAQPLAVDAAQASCSNQLAVVWKVTRNVACKPSLVLLKDLLFMIDDGGIACCLEANTGAEIWRERVGGNYSASPVAAEGRLYFFSEEGKSTVLEAGREFKVLAQNQIEDGFMASPAIAGKAFFLRTKTHLYRIEHEPWNPE